MCLYEQLHSTIISFIVFFVFSSLSLLRSTFAHHLYFSCRRCQLRLSSLSIIPVDHSCRLSLSIIPVYLSTIPVYHPCLSLLYTCLSSLFSSPIIPVYVANHSSLLRTSSLQLPHVVLAESLQVFNKTATRLPEAMFLRFNPVNVPDGAVSMEKLGAWMDPLDVVDGGAKHMHCVSDGGIAFTNTQSARLGVRYFVCSQRTRT